MLALTGQPGDWCLRTDVAVGYVIVGADPSVIAGWEAFTVPGSAVTSINGQVGTVVLGAADVGAVQRTGDNMTGNLTLGTDKAVLSTDGSATFTGTIERNGPPNTTSFFSNSPANNTNGAHFIGKNGDTDVCILNADGSVTFGHSSAQQVNLRPSQVGNGDAIWLQNSDNSRPFLVTADGSATFAGGDIQLNDNGGATFGSLSISLDPNGRLACRPSGDEDVALSIGKKGSGEFATIKANGSATFAGDVIIGTYAVNKGYARLSDGQLELGRTAANAGSGFIVGTTYDADGNGNQNLYIGADGSATFAGAVQTPEVEVYKKGTDSPGATSGVIGLGIIDGGSTIKQAEIKTVAIGSGGPGGYGGKLEFYTKQDASDGNQKKLALTLFDTQEAKFESNGSFAGTVDVQRLNAGDVSQTTPAITATIDSDTDAPIYARNNKGSAQPCYAAAGGDGAVKAAINNDGSAEFVGDVKVGTSQAAGLILTSPNGTKYRLVVDDAGTLSTVAV